MSQLDLLQTNCDQYSQRVSDLAEAQNWSEEQVLGMLKNRDHIQQILDQRVRPVTEEVIPLALWLDLTKTDASLQEQASWLAEYKPLQVWRKSFNPPIHYWWWYPTVPGLSQNSNNWLWGSLTVTTLTLNFALTQDIATRFLAGAAGVGVWSSVGAMVPIILTLFASGGVLTQVGQNLLASLFTNRGPALRHLPKFKFCLAAVLLAGLFTFHTAGLPTIARLYNQRGKNLYQQGDWASAQADLIRALKLQPEFPEAQFRLGVIYEEYQEHDLAQRKYLNAVQGGYLPAYNNLAHLYIQQKDYIKATPLLRLALSNPALVQQGSELEYVLRKNLGQARLAQDRFLEAETELMEATRLSETLTPPRPGAYCLLAQVLEKQTTLQDQSLSIASSENKTNSLPSVEKAWNHCLTYANRPEYDIWEGMARKALTHQEMLNDAAKAEQ